MSEVKPPVRKRAAPVAWSSSDAEALLFAHAGPALVLDAQGGLQTANAPALELLGLTSLAELHARPSWRSRPFRDFLSIDAQAAVARLVAAPDGRGG